MDCGPKEGRWVQVDVLRRSRQNENWKFLSTESVEGAALALESVDDIHGGDGLSLGVLAVGDGISDDVLEEHLQNSTSLLVDEAGDSLDSSTTGKTTDGGLGDSLDVITQDFAMALGSSLAESFSSLSTTRHVDAVDG